MPHRDPEVRARYLRDYVARNPERHRADSRASARRWRERRHLSPGAQSALIAVQRALGHTREAGLRKRLGEALANLRRLYGLPEAQFEETGDLKKRRSS